MSEVPKIQHPTILWVDGYWDGPLSGMCEVDGERLYFHMQDEADDKRRTRTFNVYRLTDEQMADHDHRHAEFIKHVGTYWDYRPEVPKLPTGYHPQSEHHKFYDVFKDVEDPVLADEQIVAWYDDAE
jgi:hypothetical protein